MHAASMGRDHGVSASGSVSALWSWLPPAPATRRRSPLWLRVCWRVALTLVLAGFAAVGSKLLQALR
ncbi:MAG TPA: hypothetical protein VGW33_03940 [Terriglobia bacterium]|nr:hypothetical protein [Terriglobia bacterium]